MSASALVVTIGASLRAATMARGDGAGMALFAEDIDDVGEIGLGGRRDHVGRGRAVMAHPHVERAAEPEREAALGLVELHRGHADVHHHAIDRGMALRCADVGEIGEAVLDQREPAVGSIDQIEAARNRRAVAVDADDAGSGDVEDGAAVAAGAEGGVDIDAAVAGAEHLDRLAAEDGNMARRSRVHAPAPGVVQRGKLWKLDANGPIAPQMSALRRAFPVEKHRSPNPGQARLPIPLTRIATPDFPMEFAGLPWDFERQCGLGRPQNRFGSSPLSNVS